MPHTTPPPTLPPLEIGGILLAPVIVGLVELAKLIGLPPGAARWLSALLSVLAYTGIYALTQRPDMMQPTTLVLNAVIIFLTTAGLYHQAKAALTG